jgi:serine/threonine-protein kinase RsbW
MRDSGGDLPRLPLSGGLRLTFWSDPAAVRQGMAALFAAPLLAELSTDDRGKAEIVLAEVLNNIVEHAYADVTGRIDLALWQDGAHLCVDVRDDGAAMPDGLIPVGRAPDPAALPEGGFGWFLIRRLAEDLSHRRDGGRNRFTFRLPLEQCPQ